MTQQRYRVALQYLCQDTLFVTARNRKEAAQLAKKRLTNPSSPPLAVKVYETGGIIRHYQPKVTLIPSPTK